MRIQNYRIFATVEYDEWFEEQTKKEQYQIEDRLNKIKQDGYFGNHKSVSDDDTVWELKWVNGRRIYYAYLAEQNILLLYPL